MGPAHRTRVPRAHPPGNRLHGEPLHPRRVCRLRRRVHRVEGQPRAPEPPPPRGVGLLGVQDREADGRKCLLPFETRALEANCQLQKEKFLRIIAADPSQQLPYPATDRRSEERPLTSDRD